jgi:hypothetical protein
MTQANPNPPGLAYVENTDTNIRNSAQNSVGMPEVFDFDGLPVKQSERIEYVDLDPATTQRLTEISPSVIAYDFWKFVYIKPKKPDKPPFLKFDGLYFDGVIRRIEELGYRKRRTPGKIGTENNQPWIPIHVDGAIIEPVEIGSIMQAFRERYIEPLLEPDADKIVFSHRDANVNEYPLMLSETFIKQQHNIINVNTLLLNLSPYDVPELKDSKTGTHLFFRNGIIKATKDGLERFEYDQVKNACIWRGRLIPHPYNGVTDTGGHFETFIRNVSRADTEPNRYNAFRSAIGYLLHNYNNSAMGQAVVAYDEAPSKKNEPAGGTGKGLFANAIKQMRTVDKIDGKALDDNRFAWQEISTQTQVVWLDDPKPSFDFKMLYSCLTDGWNVERKNKDRIYIPPADSPKVLIATNTAISNAGSSNKRRQFIIEFSDYYSRHIIEGNEEPIRSEHGRVFFSDNPNDGWTAKDQQQFYSFMLDCAVYYLEHGLVAYEHINVKRNQLVIATGDDFAEWVIAKNLEFTQGRHDKAVLFDDFKTQYLGDDPHIKQRTFTEWLKRWASIYGFEVKQGKSNGGGFIEFIPK